MEKETREARPRPEERPPAPQGEGTAEAARRQLIVTAAVTLALLAAILAGILIFQAVRAPGFSGRSLLEFDGLTYEQVEESTEYAALGLPYPLTEDSLGEKVAALSGSREGTVLYRLEGKETRALLAAEEDGELALYRFCYFSDGEGHSGEEILAVITDGTALSGVDIYGNTGSWSRLLRDEEELAAFEKAFSALPPAPEQEALRAQMDQASWDTMVTLQCENGLRFHLSVYSELGIAAGFRTIYSLPADFLAFMQEDG